MIRMIRALLQIFTWVFRTSYLESSMSPNGCLCHMTLPPGVDESGIDTDRKVLVVATRAT